MSSFLQFLTGQNPLSIRALGLEELETYAVKDKHVRNLLGSFKTLKDAEADGRLFVVDFHTGYIDYIHKVAELREGGKNSKDKTQPFDGVLYAGRCVFFKQ